MRYRFGAYELDLGQRELRRAGAPVHLQHQVFQLLAYLVRHADRVVPKGELLENVWRDAHANDARLQDAVSSARAAVGAEGTESIQADADGGYRFVVPLERLPATLPSAAAPPRYVRSGDVHIAYDVLGHRQGVDIVLCFGWAFPMRAAREHPAFSAHLLRLAQVGRVVLFDKRGTGLSDRVQQLPTLEQRMDDLRAVLDATASKDVVVVGHSEGGSLAVLFATTYPERVRGLVLVGAFARMSHAPDYPCGWREEDVEQLRSYIAGRWGAGATILPLVASAAEDPDIRAWCSRAELEGASPETALGLLEMNLAIDVRDLLPLVSVPTAIAYRAQDSVIDPDNGRYLAEHIRGSRVVEVPGSDHALFHAEDDVVLQQVRVLLDPSRGAAAAR